MKEWKKTTLDINSLIYKVFLFVLRRVPLDSFLMRDCVLMHALHLRLALWRELLEEDPSSYTWRLVVLQGFLSVVLFSPPKCIYLWVIQGIHFYLLLVKGLFHFFEDAGATFADWMTFPVLDWPRGHSLTLRVIFIPLTPTVSQFVCFSVKRLHLLSLSFFMHKLM